MNGAQAEGCSPVASAFAAGHDVCRPVKPNTIAKSLAIGNPADGPYALDLARRTRRLGGRRQRRGDPRRHRAAGGDDRRLHRDSRRRHDRRAGQARRARRHRPRRARRAGDHRRGPEDARRGARHVRDVHDRPDRRGLRDADVRGAGSSPRAALRVSESDERGREDPDAAARRRRRVRPRRRSTARPSQEVLNGLFERLGELRERISDEDGSLRRFVNVYLAGEDIRFLDGLATPVADGAELTILPAVAGG